MSNARVYSVVLCSYNKLPSLKRVAERVKSLRREVELILSDDCSTDGTQQWAEESRLFAHVRSEAFPGNYRLNTIRNAGIALASWKYVVLLDADCLPEETYFQGFDDVFSIHPNSASIGITKRYDATGETQLVPDSRWNEADGTSVHEHEWTDFYGGNVAFPKALWESDKFDEQYNGNWGFEDLDIAIRWNKKHVHFFLAPQSCARHLDHPPCKQSVDAHSGRCINREKFEAKHGGKFYGKDPSSMPTISTPSVTQTLSKKIVICKNVKPLRNGRRNPKDFPYWKALRDLLVGHDIILIDKELPLPELAKVILGCDFWISPDSFFQHYAWSLGKVGVVLFSITDPLIFGHPENLNILKDRKYLRSNPFLWMENETYNPDSFLPAEQVFKLIAESFLQQE